MNLSAERLRREAGSTGFRPENLEKVDRLLDLLEFVQRHPYLKSRLALKGGTALNLFVFDVPRLSVDIDVNYIGALDRKTMLAERQSLEIAMEAVAGWLGLTLQRAPQRWQVAAEIRQCAGTGRHAGTGYQLHVQDAALADQTSGFQGSGHPAGDGNTSA